MGVFILIPLALLVIGSLAAQLPIHHSLITDVKSENFLFEGTKWVVLVAGSEEWSNYRHQADLCHAYQIIRRNGIPKKNIITMMVDDIAFNPRNPTPGKIVNQPNGTNVYEGVEIDYNGTDVTSTNFLNIITGNKTAMNSIGSGKVVEGNSLDRIFIYFSDHGASGLLAFPGDLLFLDQLNDAFETMYRRKTYRKMLLYIEACNSGSMFDGILKEDMNILAVTAAGPRESSYGCYCNSDQYNTCLGDLFSVIWMENLDETAFEKSARKRTIFNNFKDIRTNVTYSNVMMYGDFNVGHDKLSSFIGYPKNLSPKKNMNTPKMPLSSRDVDEHTVRRELANKKLTSLDKHKLTMKLRLNNEMRTIIDSVFREIYSKVVKVFPEIKNQIGEFDEPQHLHLSLDIFPCYKNILKNINNSCFSIPRNPYTLDRLTIFANLCVVDKQIHQTVINVINESCLRIPKNIINVF